MKKLLVLIVVVLLGLSFLYGCGKKDVKEDTTKVPVEVQEAEQADSTALDSAALDTVDVETTDPEAETQ